MLPHPLVIGLLSFLLCVGREVMLALAELAGCNWHILIHISCKDGSSAVASAPSGVLVERPIGSSGASACGACGCCD